MFWKRSSPKPRAIIGDGDRKSWDPHAGMSWDNFSIFRTNCAIRTSTIRTSNIRADPPECRLFSRGCCDQMLRAWEILLRIFHSDGRKWGREEEPRLFCILLCSKLMERCVFLGSETSLVSLCECAVVGVKFWVCSAEKSALRELFTMVSR